MAFLQFGILDFFVVVCYDLFIKLKEIFAMPSVMISYSHKDQQYANMIVAILEQNNIKCWIDYRDAMPGANYAGSIVRAIKNSDFVIVILSSNSIESPQVLNEVNSAVNNGVSIIPFKIEEGALNDNMEYYIGKTHWLDAITPPLEEHIYRLVDTINKNASTSRSVETEYAPKQRIDASSKRSCRMVKFADLLDLGYTASKIATQLVENDYINCNGIGEENEGSAEQWEGFLQDNSDTFQYLINGENKIVGDWSIVALTDEAYDLACRGELLEADIGEDNTALICFPDYYNGYILTFSLLPQYRTMENYNLIIDSFFKQIEDYSNEGVFFKHWCINVFGKEVEALVKRMGFKFVCNNKVFGKIYTCNFIPLPNVPLLKKYPNLIKNYEELQH